jgi:DNA-binding LacI/PurR family transcriptional regulator
MPKIKSKSTIKEVAERAGVSTATVSRVLTGKDVVSPARRKRVDRAIEELGFRPNRAARELRVGAELKIGVVLSDIQNPFFTSCLAGIESVLQSSEYVLILGNSNEDPRIEKMHLNSLISDGIGGIIVALTSSYDECYQYLADTDIPIVAIDRECKDLPIDSVLLDNVSASRQATECLVKLGHRRIGYIGGPLHISTSQDRLKGYRDVLTALDIPIEDDLIVNGQYRQEGGRLAMEELLNLVEPPTALLIANNLMTLGALETIYQHDIKIPEDLALVAFDDTPWNIALKTPLTVIAQPTYQLGELATKLLLERIKNPDQPKQKKLLKGELIIRDSCGSKIS